MSILARVKGSGAENHPLRGAGCRDCEVSVLPLRQWD